MEAARTVLACVSALYDRMGWALDEWRLKRRMLKREQSGGPMMEEPPAELVEACSPLAWYAEFFGKLDDAAVFWELQELFLWTYPDVLGLSEYVPEHWERVT